MEIEFIPDKNLSKQQLRIIKELNNMIETIDDINVIMSEDVKHTSHSKKITNNEAQYKFITEFIENLNTPMQLYDLKPCDVNNKFFGDEHGFNSQFLYLQIFNEVPNITTINNIYFDKAVYNLIKEFGYKINSGIHTRVYNKKKVPYPDMIYFFIDDIMIYISYDFSTFEIFYTSPSQNMELINSICNLIVKYKTTNDFTKPQIFLLTNGRSGFDLNPLVISKPKLSIADNYNDDFIEVHKTIIKRLKTKNDKGLLLLHGDPGTGKSSYIKYLISQVKKNVIFLPSNIAGAITDPSLMNVLIENPNSIFVIEDAENIITDRDLSGNSAVTALLNLTDGLLSDCLNIQIICTFNNDISKVDRALLRKGRLIAKYEFCKLTKEKAQQLSDKLGFDTVIEEPMDLTHIYNQDDPEFEPLKKRTKIGF